MMDHDPTNSTAPSDASGSTDPIERVLRLTGPRPPAPMERMERVREAVHAHWRSEITPSVSRSRGRTTWLAAAAAAIVVVAGGLALYKAFGPQPPLEAFGRVEAIEGSVWVSARSGSAQRTPVPLGAEIPVGSHVTTDAGGRLALRLASGQSLRLDEDTRLHIVTLRSLALETGAVYAASPAPGMPAPDPLEVRTPIAEIREIGTQFEVRALPSALRVRVREGAVSLEHDSGTVRVETGREVEVDASGAVRERALAPDAAEWDWVGAVAPMLDLEKRPLRDFLDWMARERGLRLSFSSPDLAASAEMITLSGSTAGMSLDQALASVLSTCHMTHRIADGVLHIEEQSEAPGAS